MSSTRHELTPEERIDAVLNTAPQPVYWPGAWDTGNGDVSDFVERDLAAAREERRNQKGRD